MSSLRRRLKAKNAPKGWDKIEDAIEDFEQQMSEAVDEEHEGKRKAELTWKIHRIHWEKNRFIYDLMYVRKAISRQLVRCCARLHCTQLDGTIVLCSAQAQSASLCTALSLAVLVLPRFAAVLTIARRACQKA
jgi:bud site selection protein 31